MEKKAETDEKIPFREPQRLGRDFFTTDGLTLARSLLGKVLVHVTPYGTVRGIITETEGYMGPEDKGAHTYGGKRTARTEPMFHIGGTSYVYLIYGMYSCMNVAANVEEIPQAVLIRMAEPFDGTSRRIMLRLREEGLAGRKKTGDLAAGKDAGRERGEPQKKNALSAHLADGPGRLCIAMDITRRDNDVDMVESNTFYWTEGIEVSGEEIAEGRRIGIDYAEEAADYLWRFTLKRRRKGV